ncbi:hypothetical protein Q4595_17500, partial [Wenyingzhuangia sp. 1_MG-2023]|nr:hypothetical protein [Wenyingzhuangia sp. 1_MG-2023]
MQSSADRQLSLTGLLEDMRRDRLLSSSDYEQALGIRRQAGEASLHPLTLLARQNFQDARPHGKTLTEDVLCEWLAQRVNMTTCQIDPLEIDVPSVTEVMSYAFAERHCILAVRVSAEEVVVATAE